MNIIKHIGDRLSIYILLATLAALMVYYVMVYVPDNEQKLNSYGVRILENKAISIKEKYSAYSNAINSGTLSYFAAWFFTRNKKDTVYYIDLDTAFLYSVNKELLPEIKGAHTESLTREQYWKLGRWDSKRLIPHKQGPLTDGEDRDVWEVKNGKFYFVYNHDENFYYYHPTDVNTGVTLGEKSASGKRPPKNGQPDRVFHYFWLSIGNFTSNLKSNDFFDDFFLLRDPAGKENYDNKKGQGVSGFDSQVLDESEFKIARFPLPDNAGDNGSGILTKEIAGKSYKVYYKLVNLKRGLNVYIVGLVSADSFTKQARRVAPWFFVFCILGALVLLLVLPVLKLFFLNEHERLSAVDAKVSVFSVIMCVSLMVTLLIGGFLFWAKEGMGTDNTLQTLSDKIHKRVNDEVTLLYKILQKQDLISSNNPAQTKLIDGKDTITFNEVFTLTKDGYMKDMFDSDPKKDTDPKKFEIRVDGRNYFRYVKSLIDAKQEGEMDYMVESINSLLSGKSEAAVSIPYDDGGGGIIRVITSSLPSVINAIVPEPYQFVVLDRQGFIKFHSRRSELKFENFIHECDGDEFLQAHLDNSIKGHVSFSYLLNDCRGYVRPLHKDWYLVVFYEAGNTRSFAAQVFSLCIVTLVLLTLYNTLILAILRKDMPRPLMLNIKPFVFDWLNPNRQDPSVWLGLAWMNVSLFSLELLWLMLNKSVTLSLFFIFLVVTLTYYINYRKLRRNNPSQGRLSSLNLLLILIGFWGIFLIAEGQFFYKSFTSWIIIPLLGFVTAASFSQSKKIQKVKNVLKKSNLGRYNSYRLFLCSWLLVIAIGPTSIFISNHYDFQNIIHTYSFLLEDVKKVQVTLTSELNGSRGFDYTDQMKENKLKLLNGKSHDFQFYGLVPRYGVHDASVSGLQFNYLPDFEHYSVYASGDTIGVTAPASTMKNVEKVEGGNDNKNEIFRARSINGQHVGLNAAAWYIFLVMALAAWLFWWAMKEIPRKIFFMPGHDGWKKYPARDHKEIKFEQEFDDDEIEHHPLHGFLEKNNLLESYKTEKVKGLTGDKAKFVEEEYIDKLQKEAADSYRTAWSNCTEKEKFFLYDLAEDGVANQLDHSLVRSLSEKGLIRLIPDLEIVNHSFAAYVKDGMNEEDVAKWKQKEESQGRWKNLRVMLIIIIIAALAFLSIAEEEFLGRASAILASIAVVIPNLINVVGAVGKLFSKS